MFVCVCPGPRKAPFSTNTPIFTNYFFTLKVISAAVVVSLLWNTFPLLHPAPMGRTRSLCSFQTKRWIVVKNCFCVIQVCPAGYFSRRKLRFSFPIFFFPGRKLWAGDPAVFCISKLVIKGEKLTSEAGKGWHFQLISKYMWYKIPHLMF